VEEAAVLDDINSVEQELLAKDFHVDPLPGVFKVQASNDTSSLNCDRLMHFFTICENKV
jgi:hypothetical protein